MFETVLTYPRARVIEETPKGSMKAVSKTFFNGNLSRREKEMEIPKIIEIAVARNPKVKLFFIDFKGFTPRNGLRSVEKTTL